MTRDDHGGLVSLKIFVETGTGTPWPRDIQS
jgi:hypothetical protein